MAAKYILAGLALLFMGMALVRGGSSHTQDEGMADDHRHLFRGHRLVVLEELSGDVLLAASFAAALFRVALARPN